MCVWGGEDEGQELTQEILMCFHAEAGGQECSPESMGRWGPEIKKGVRCEPGGRDEQDWGLVTTCSLPLGSRKELWANGSLFLPQNIHQHEGTWEQTAVGITQRQMWERLGVR